MNRILLLLITLVISHLSFSSCTRDEEKDNAFNQLHLNYYEQFHPQGRELIFFLETVETFPCSNFQIQTSVEYTPDHTWIKSDNIEVPNLCVTSIGPATRSLSMGAPGQMPGNISLWVNKNRHDFDLELHDTHYQIKRQSHFENRLSFSRERLMRIPNHTVWGYILTDDQNKSDITAQIIEAFEAKGASVINLPEGEYHYFRVENELPHFRLDKEISGFTLWFDQNISILVQAFEEYLETTHTSSHIQLRLFSTRGERHIM